MTNCTHHLAALIVCATFSLPSLGIAASLSPLGDTTGIDAALPGLGPVPGLSDTPGIPDLGTSEIGAKAPTPFKFVDDTGLDANPLRSVLPENQWANPQAAQNGRIQRR